MISKLTPLFGLLPTNMLTYLSSVQDETLEGCDRLLNQITRANLDNVELGMVEKKLSREPGGHRYVVLDTDA